jgi:protein TonB
MSAFSRPIRQQGEKGRPGKLIGLAAALALHAAAIALALQIPPVRSAITRGAPIMVSLISPPRIAGKPQEQPRPLPVEPKAKMRRQQPVEPPPVLTAAAEAPVPSVAPPVPPAPAAVEFAAPPAPPAPAPTPAAAEIPPPVIPPSLNADYLHNPALAYPPLARRLGEQGKVVLRVLVNSSGTPDRVELRTSSGSRLLDTAALEAVRHWRFVPARQGDQPVAAWVLIPITFTLEG